MDKKEIVAGDFKFKHVDSANWQVFERRKIKETGNKDRRKRAGEVDWVGLPAFYGTLLSAIVKAKELNRVRKVPTGDLDAAVKAIAKADSEFLDAVRKALS